MKINVRLIIFIFIDILTFQVSIDIGSDMADFSSALSRTKMAELNGKSKIIPILSTISSKQNIVRKPTEHLLPEAGIFFSCYLLVYYLYFYIVFFIYNLILFGETIFQGKISSMDP